MYILFTNDIPDLVHDHNIDFAKPRSFCEGCGGTVCYVDDATFSVADKNPATLSIKLSEQYETIADYMAAKGRLPKGYLGIFPKLLSPPPPLGTLGITIIWEKPLFSKRPPCSLIWEKLQLKKEIV